LTPTLVVQALLFVEAPLFTTKVMYRPPRTCKEECEGHEEKAMLVIGGRAAPAR